MPRLNARGDWCAGVGGGQVTVNGTVVATNAGGACWLDEHRVLYQQDAHLCTYDVRTGVIMPIDTQGSFELAAGGGVYAAKFTDGVRVSNRPGERWPGHGIADVTPTGAVLLKGPDGLFQGRLIADVQGVDVARWSGLEGARPVSVGLPPAVTVDGPIYGLRRAGSYCCYLAGEGARFIVQHLDRPVGTVLAITNNAHRPDLVVLPNGLIRVIYATEEGEPAGSERLFEVDPRELTTDLRAVVVVPEPKPEPAPMLPERHHLDVVERLAKTIPHERTLAYAWKLCTAIAYELKDEGCGLHDRPASGENVMTVDGQTYGASRVMYKDGDLYKIVSDAGDGGANKPQWAREDPIDPARWRAPLKPDGATAPVDPTRPPADWQAAVAKLETAYGLLLTTVGAHDAEIEALEDLVMRLRDRVTVLEQRPTGTPVGLTVDGTIGRSFGHSHAFTGTIKANPTVTP